MTPEMVVNWRESLVRLSDQYFFDLIRMYLGAVRTPFNKQKLIEELSAFLRKKEHREKILLGLDRLDLMILSAVRGLPHPTQQKLVSLFAGSWTFPQLYERILNLEERLIIYRRSDQEGREYALNPLLEDDLGPLTGRNVLVQPESRGEPVQVPLRIDDLTLAALYSFFIHEGEAVRNDGSFRKKTLESLEAVFPQLAGQSDALRFLLSSFQNLGLLVKQEGRLVPDPARWESFARLARPARIAWLVAAAGGRFQRDSLQLRAQIFLDFFAALEPDARYTREAVSRLAFLLSEQTGRVSVPRGQGRFAGIIREQEARLAGTDEAAGDFTETAITFGLLVETGGLWARNNVITLLPAGSAADPYLVVSPSLAVTLMPGFSLSDLLPLASCMEVRDIQIAGQFEITRHSCAAAFDQGLDADALCDLFTARSVQPVPRNVLFSIRDWFRTYSSVSLYHGFVLRVDDSRRVFFENNEHLSGMIRKILAPGLYLLDAGTPEEIGEAFALAGLDSVPAVSTPAPNRELAQLPPLRISGEPERVHAPAASQAASPDPLPYGPGVNGEGLAGHRKTLLEALDALGLPPDLHDSLASRIDRRIILSPSQLDPDSVRVEKVEARGMDFLGKVRIAEYALVSGSLLEIHLDEKDGNRQLLGRPLSTEKRTGDVLLKLATEPDQTIEQISLGKAVLVRRIRGSIFSELPAGRK